jgi:hypothetical protein
MGTTEALAALDPVRAHSSGAAQAGSASEPSSGMQLPSRARLLLFVLLLPATVAGTNQFILEFASPSFLRARLYPWMALSTAVLSWTIGRYLSPAWLQWLVFAWCLSLLDLLTIAACLGGGPIQYHFAFVLVATQISLLAVWAIFGLVRWQWSLPGLLIATPALVHFSGSFDPYWSNRSWNALMVLTAVVTLLLCGAVRASGFKLQKPASATSASTENAEMGSLQFGLKHLLVWATAMVPMLLLVRGVDFLILQSLGSRGAFPLAFLGASVATINLTVLWAVLGRGAWIIRLLALFVIPFVPAFGSIALMNYVESSYRLQSPRNFSYDSLMYGIYRARDTWRAWLWLDAAFLAAVLLFFRASGYRLVRGIQGGHEVRRA